MKDGWNGAGWGVEVEGRRKGKEGTSEGLVDEARGFRVKGGRS